ncbi:Squamosa promoter-binding-like protein 2 [Hibiscus syriacus]|uniref:Squamosa promoter-binding-like protein 2 n=1 Tax=Hibiscus syriacus TaxID=106335 RepID=A0A6A3B321_HIBSY|nr:teosinte glume architecture 1-like [Hibiscus syriacus]KAE8710268.1 Squamosa promoter-binding-like protein 2 [Hibiscus syriacus]
MEPSSSISFKRARPPGRGNRVPSCLVDGCTTDLSKCRDYHRRHKVCEVHSKTPKVTIRGQEQRFCQQCSRFHSLVEFDEEKRSCRKRLDGHNRRRRKLQPDYLSVSPGRCLSNLQGFRHTQFGSHQVLAPIVITSSWLGTVKAETDISLEPELNFGNLNGSFRGSLPHNYIGEEQFSFLQTNNSSLPGVSICQPILDVNPSSSNGCDRARCLLSLQLAEAGEIGLSPMVQSGTTSSLIPNLQFSCLAMQGKQEGTMLATDDSSNTNLHENEMFRNWRSGSLSATGTHQTHSSSWE